MKTLLFSGALFLGIFIGQTWDQIAYQRNELAKDPVGKYHNVCKSRIEGKLHGKSCTICVKKWALDHPPKSEVQSLLEYCERKNGKKAKNFTDEEMCEFLTM